MEYYCLAVEYTEHGPLNYNGFSSSFVEYRIFWGDLKAESKLTTPYLTKLKNSTKHEFLTKVEDVVSLSQKSIADNWCSCTQPCCSCKSDSIDHFDADIKDEHLDNPYRHLFIFAILNNFRDMAEYFWEEGNDHLSAALTAAMLYDEMERTNGNKSTELNERLQKSKSKFEDLAYDMLTEYEKETEGRDTLTLLINKQPNWGDATCLSLAETTENRRFISHSAVQGLLDYVWNHGLPTGRSQCTTAPTKTTFQWFVDCIHGRTPVATFITNTLSYILFLALFSYVMVSDQLSNVMPTGYEWLVFVWVASLIVEELRQVIVSWKHFADYARSPWNMIDVLMLFSYTVGALVRILWNGDMARVFLALSLFLFYMRFLHTLTFFESTGPKVLMIGQMFIDLWLFVVICAIVLIGYGLAVQSILYPHVNDPVTVLGGVIYRPFFQIYGELFLDNMRETEDDGMCTSNLTEIRLGAEPCPEYPILGVICLGLYMMFSNVLLLNLLVAMFSNTFNKVTHQNDIHWKFQRYMLTEEYHSRPGLPPPFIIFAHFYRCVRFFLHGDFSTKWTTPRMELEPESCDMIKATRKRASYDYILRKRKDRREEFRRNDVPARLDTLEKITRAIKDKQHS